MTNRLALGAIVGPILFTLAWLTLGFVSPGYSAWGILIQPYSAVAQPISGLGLGPTGPYMNAAFILGGLLLITGVIGIFRAIPELGSRPRWACAMLLALSGVGMVIDGFFTLESFFAHFVGFALGIGSTVLSFTISGLVIRRVPRWRRFADALIWGGPVTLLLLVISQLSFDPVASGAGLGVGGLTQRALVLEVHAWFVAMGWLAARSTASTSHTAVEAAA